MIEFYKEVVFIRDIPKDQLKAGDVAALIDLYPHPRDGEQGCILEVFNAVGETIAVITFPISAIKSLQSDQVLSVRSRS